MRHPIYCWPEATQLARVLSFLLIAQSRRRALPLHALRFLHNLPGGTGIARWADQNAWKVKLDKKWRYRDIIEAQYWLGQHLCDLKVDKCLKTAKLTRRVQCSAFLLSEYTGVDILQKHTHGMHRVCFCIWTAIIVQLYTVSTKAGKPADLYNDAQRLQLQCCCQRNRMGL